MLDTTANPSPACSDFDLNDFAKARLFVNGEHTAGDDTTRQFILELLQEIGVLNGPFETHEGITLSKRVAGMVEKYVCFMASFLRVCTRVTDFGILMDRHRWTWSPCGYASASKVTKALLAVGHLVKRSNPKKYKQCTVYRCSDAFRERLSAFGELCFKRTCTHAVEVREPRNDYKAGHKAFAKKRVYLGRFPLEEVKRHKTSVEHLNGRLASFVFRDAKGVCFDPRLRRIFTGDLTSGGRLYSDYQSMPERDRLQFTIDGQPVSEIDLKASHVAILAALYRHDRRLPCDPYSAISWVKTPSDRKAAKTLVQCMVHATGGRPAKFPKGGGQVTFRDKYGLGSSRIQDLLPGIFDVLPFLDGSPRLTLILQFLEAEMLMSALQVIVGLGIPALPVHDSILVKQSDVAVALKVLTQTLMSHLGPHAPWLDVSTSNETPYLVPPILCPMDADYLLKDHFEQSPRSVEYEEQTEVIDLYDTEGF